MLNWKVPRHLLTEIKMISSLRMLMFYVLTSLSSMSINCKDRIKTFNCIQTGQMTAGFLVVFSGLQVQHPCITCILQKSFLVSCYIDFSCIFNQFMLQLIILLILQQLRCDLIFHVFLDGAHLNSVFFWLKREFYSSETNTTKLAHKEQSSESPSYTANQK